MWSRIERRYAEVFVSSSMPWARTHFWPEHATIWPGTEMKRPICTVPWKAYTSMATGFGTLEEPLLATHGLDEGYAKSQTVLRRIEVASAGISDASV